jgi:hypothetical protein
MNSLKNANRLCGFDLADSETTTKPAEFISFIEMSIFSTGTFSFYT